MNDPLIVATVLSRVMDPVSERLAADSDLVPRCYIVRGSVEISCDNPSIVTAITCGTRYSRRGTPDR